MKEPDPTKNNESDPPARGSQSDLIPLTPSEGLDLYLREMRNEYAQTSIETHRSRLHWLPEWCEKEGIENLNELNGRDLHEFRLWRREEHGLNPVSEKHSQYTLKRHVRFLESIDAVRPDLAEKVIVPSVSREEGIRSAMIEKERIENILDYVEKFHYASTANVVLRLIGGAGMRVGTARAIDVEDVCLDAEPPHLKIRHRPGETPLKNQSRAERRVSLLGNSPSVMSDYLADSHPKVEDEYGRMPFLGTKHGRACDSTIRRHIYRWTRPCVISGECPHDLDIEDCPAADNGHKASGCRYSEAPHAVRRGYLTHLLEKDVPADVIGDRVDVTPQVLEEYYDQRGEEQKMEQRREILGAAEKEGSE